MLFCRQDMQFCHLTPAVELPYWASLHVISEFPVFDEVGSDASSAVESRHIEAHGEFGVTWSAVLNWLSR